MQVGEGSQPAARKTREWQLCGVQSRTEEEEKVELLRCLEVGLTEKEKKKSCSAVLCVVAP